MPTNDRKSFLFSNLIALISLILLAIFPAGDFFQQIFVSIAFLLVLPWVFIRLVLQDSLKNYGVWRGKKEQGIIWFILSVVFLGIILFFLLRYTSFARNFTLTAATRHDFLLYIYEVLSALILLGLYEFFFRGFIMTSWKERIGIKAVFLQALIFAFFFLVLPDFDWTAFTFSAASWDGVYYTALALCSGFIVYFSHSLFPALLFDFISVIIVTVVIIRFF